jgi:hypothetical protein
MTWKDIIHYAIHGSPLPEKRIKKPKKNGKKY